MAGFVRVSALSVAVALLFGCAALRPGDRAAEDLALRGANTPAEHETLAQYYRARAEEARAEARRHERMAVNFRSRTGPLRRTRTEMNAHCEKIEEAQEALAREYDEMARLNQEEAKSPQKDAADEPTPSAP